MNLNVKLDDELYYDMVKVSGELRTATWVDFFKKILSERATPPETNSDFKESKVDAHGKASISRTLAGRTIEWRIKK